MINQDEQYFLHNKGKFEPFQLNLQTSTNTLFSLEWGCSQVHGGQVCVCCTAARFQSDGRSREQQSPLTDFSLKLPGCSGAFRCRLFSTPSDGHPLTTTILQSAMLSAHFCVSFLLCLSKSAFEMPYICLHDVPTGLRCSEGTPLVPI